MSFDRIVEEVSGLLMRGCVRLQAVGDYRRCVVTSHVELAVEPLMAKDLFGCPSFDELNETISQRVRETKLAWTRDHGQLDGLAHYHLQITKAGKTYPITVYAIRAPDQWGVAVAELTGPPPWWGRMIAKAEAMGMAIDRRQLRGRDGTPLAVPTEQDFFTWLELREQPASMRR